MAAESMGDADLVTDTELRWGGTNDMMSFSNTLEIERQV